MKCINRCDVILTTQKALTQIEFARLKKLFSHLLTFIIIQNGFCTRLLLISRRTKVDLIVCVSFETVSSSLNLGLALNRHFLTEIELKK